MFPRSTVAVAAALALLALAPSAARGELIFSEVREVAGLKLYADSERSDLFYYPPAGIALQRNGETPVFSFLRYRYIGRRVTGDSNTFLGRGVLSFTVEFQSQRDRLHSVKRALERRLRRQVTLLPAPVADMGADLIYSAVKEGETEEHSGVLSGGSWGGGEEETGEYWDVRTFSIGADPYSTNLLWQTYHDGKVLLALSVSVVASGLPERQLPDGPVPERVVRTVFADTIRVEVSPEGFPELFSSVDINERMPAGYTFLDVYCHDFSEGWSQEREISRVIVEIRGRAISGDHPVERVSFEAEKPEEVKRSVHFRFAMDLNAGYSFRVTRVERGGNMTTGEWIDVADWNGICDVSMTQRDQMILDSKPIDPRMLY